MRNKRERKPVAGVWTPWAEALCRTCHDACGREMKRTIEWPADEKRQGDAKGYCAQCDAPVWLADDVAQLTRLRRLVGGDMEQTGGMCAALTIHRIDGGVVVVTNLNGPVDIGIYPTEEWGDENADPVVYSLPFETPDEAIAAVLRAALAEEIK